jgi:predicted TIM-barrel enzyme
MDELRAIAGGTALPVLVGSGADADNVGEILSAADGVIVASSLKVDGVWWNPVDPDRLATFMEAVRRARTVR